MNAGFPATERERELTEELATLTQMYEVCTRQRTELAAQNEGLKELLRKIFDLYENGMPCYDELEEGVFVGYAIHLDDSDFTACLKALALPNHAPEILRARDDMAIENCAKICDWQALCAKAAFREVSVAEDCAEAIRALKGKP